MVYVRYDAFDDISLASVPETYSLELAASKKQPWENSLPLSVVCESFDRLRNRRHFVKAAAAAAMTWFPFFPRLLLVAGGFLPSLRCLLWIKFYQSNLATSTRLMMAVVACC